MSKMDSDDITKLVNQLKGPLMDHIGELTKNALGEIPYAIRRELSKSDIEFELRNKIREIIDQTVVVTVKMREP